MIAPLEDVERKKYEAVWRHDAYRKVSPGMMEVERAWFVMGCEPGETLNDYGSGPARATKWFQEKGLDVLGIDIATNAAETSVIVESIPLWDLKLLRTADYGFCCDVMEHIPPEKVEDVLMWTQARSRHACYYRIATRPDVMGPKLVGEPLHLTIRDADWWKAELLKYWSLVKPLESSRQDAVFLCLG